MHSDSRHAAGPCAAPSAIARWLLILLFSLNRANAHDIPNDVTIQAILKPTGDRLELLIRVPLRAVRDVDVPTREPVFAARAFHNPDALRSDGDWKESRYCRRPGSASCGPDAELHQRIMRRVQGQQ